MFKSLNRLFILPVENTKYALVGGSVRNLHGSASLVLDSKSKKRQQLQHVQKRNASAFKFQPDTAPANLGETTKMNLCQSITNALDISLSSDKSAGESDQPLVFHLHQFTHLVSSLFCEQLFLAKTLRSVASSDAQSDSRTSTVCLQEKKSPSE